MRLIIGGDFNTVFKLDRRGELLDQLLDAFNLKIVNDPEGLSFENRWTHTGALGIQRQIDFILADRGFHVRDTFATRILDMGSDHRAVFGELLMPKRKKRRWRRPIPVKGWRPDEKYAEYVKDALKDTNCLMPEVMEIMNKAYEVSMKERNDDVVPCRKPWQSSEVQYLLALRGRSSGEERRDLSKRIQREL